MRTLTIEKQWETEYMDAPNGIKLEFNEQHIEDIKKHLEYAKENKVTIEYPFYGYLFNDIECEETADFRAEAERILIMQSGALYYTAVSKYDYSLRFESDAFGIEDLMEIEKETV